MNDDVLSRQAAVAQDQGGQDGATAARGEDEAQVGGAPAELVLDDVGNEHLTGPKKARSVTDAATSVPHNHVWERMKATPRRCPGAWTLPTPSRPAGSSWPTGRSADNAKDRGVEQEGAARPERGDRKTAERRPRETARRRAIR